MILYLAAWYESSFHKNSQMRMRQTPREFAVCDGCHNLLGSYHYIHKPIYVDRVRSDGVKLFMDSGAFSAHTLGVQLNLKDYCTYLKANADLVNVVDGDLQASVLDGIGDPLKTYQNQTAMEALGVRPLPCFHYGEDERYLEHYVQNYRYITLGGMVMQTEKSLYFWLDRIWKNYLCKSDGSPKLKVHGFGLTNVDLMRRYPWFSVDSSSWVQIASAGAIMIPTKGALPISVDSPAAKVKGRHFDNLNKPQQHAVRRYIEDLGFDVERLRNDYVARRAFNCFAYPEISKSCQTDRFVPDQIGLF